MGRFIVRRSFGAVATFLLATVVVFAVTFALPGDPAQAIAGRKQVPQSTLIAIRRRYHLDDPLPVQYLRWLGRLAHGDFGTSFVSHRQVSTIMIEAFPVTAKLLAATLVIEAAFGLLIGTLTGMRRGTRFDHTLVAGCTLALAAPLFLVGSIGQDLLGVRWHLLPVAGTGAGLRSYAMPAIVLALTGLAVAIRLVRAETLTQSSAPHVRTAVAKGLRPSAVTRRHVMRNSLIPFATFIGLEFGALAGGSVVVERIFNLPGLGHAIANAIVQRDNSLIVGFTMAIVIAYLVVDVCVDVLAVLLDPRLRELL